MKIINNELSVQSWSLRGLEGNEAVVAALREMDITAIELSGVHVNYDNCDQVIALYQNNGISISGFGVTGIRNDEASARKEFDLAKRLGLTAFAVDPDPDSYDLIETLCREYGMKVGIHNHGKHHRYGFPDQLRAVFSKHSTNIGIWLDAAWALDAGFDPIDMANECKDRLYGVHLKDFIISADETKEVIVGTGSLDLPGLLKTLNGMDYRGVISVEYELNEKNPVPDIIECIHNIRKVASTISK